MENETEISVPPVLSVERLRDCKSSGYAYSESLWERSFPESERREAAEQRALLQSEPRFALWALGCEGAPVGVMTTWDLGGFTFMEHLALDPVWQSRGLGRQAVGWAMGHLARPLVLEVELPVDATSRRRIAFYERLGFRTFPETYVQPPYRVGGAFVPMRLLQGTLDGGAGLEFEAVREILRREVYRCVDA